MATTTISPRRKLRLSLRLAMVIIVLMAIPLARLAVRARAQKEAVLAISKAGGFLPSMRHPSPTPVCKSWGRSRWPRGSTSRAPESQSRESRT